MAAAATADNLHAFLREYGHTRLELEWRIGISTAAGFRPGVPERAWNHIREVMDASAAFKKSYKETREIILEKHKHVLPDDQFVFKKRVAVIDEKCDSFVVRACLSLETVETPPAKKCTSKFERYKRRWSYAFECWTIDLTRVRSNLPGDLNSDIFEVEIELVDRDELFVRPIDNLVQYGSSIARDLCAFASI